MRARASWRVAALAVTVAAASEPVWAEPSLARARPGVLVTPTGGTTHLAVPAGEIVAVPVAGAGAPGVNVHSVPGDPERVLIELQGTPLVRARAAGARATVPVLAAQRQRAAAAIVRAASLARGRVLAQREVITREYAQVFHGFAARLPPAAQAEVRRLPDVRAVHADLELHTTLAESVPLVGAPAFWSAHSYRGAGTVIAVIDTGVDYTHPDLGGCFGTGCKVAGGFDFVNDDGDPVDDHGHGTHVTAIAAGSGTFDGVAPEASVLAYKACDSQGSCLTSDTIAALERAVDPNQDTDTSDRADVVNLSLGGPGTADDPLSLAVDNATAAGVLVVASAGNTGPAFFTIGSPGTARTALTVGATDKSDQLVSFSSRGPSPQTYGLKPEIVAPGGAICAARASGTSLGPLCAAGAHIAISGTSMAAPHVAGAGALVRGLLPALSPEEAKALLVENSLDLGLGAVEQGGGRLDALAAGAATTVVTPAAVSFGRDDLSLPVWTASAALTVRNLDTSPRSYALSTTALPAGITATPSPSAFMLGPGESRAVALDLAVDNATVPSLPAPHTYEGSVLVDSGSGPGAERQRVPFVFLKQSLLRMHLDPDSFPIAFVHDGTSVLVATLLPPYQTTVDLLIPDGRYDVIAKYANPAAVVAREGFEVNGFAEATFGRVDAPHRVSISGRDESDGELVPTGVVFELFHRGAGHLFYAGGPTAAYDFSDLSADYEVDVALHAVVDAKEYFINDLVRGGVSRNWALGNRAADLVRAAVRYHPRPPDPPAVLLPFVMVMDPSFGSFGFGSGDVNSIAHDFYANLQRQPGARLFLWPFALDARFPTIFELFFLGPLIHGGSTPGTIDAYAHFVPDAPGYVASTGELPLNLGPPFWFERLRVDSPSSIVLMPPSGLQCLSFHNQGGDGPEPFLNGMVSWELRRDGSAVRNGLLPQTPAGCANSTQTITGLAPGEYTFAVDGPPYYVAAAPGTTRLEARFDTRRSDPTPPFMSNLTLRSAGRLTDLVETGAPVTVGVHAEDDGGLAEVVVLSGSGGEMEAALALPAGTGRYEAVVPSCEPGPVALTVLARDGAGNEIRQDFDPGFVCVERRCGNGLIDAGEVCDDGNTIDGDGCDSNCTPTGCGNGIVTPPEICDDGNTIDADGCGSSCLPTHDAFVRQPRAVGLTIARGASEVLKTLRVRVTNADRPSRGVQHDDTIELVAADGTCPVGTVVEPPDFLRSTAGAQPTARLHAGGSKTALVRLRISAAAFTSLDPASPQRCTLRFAASTVVEGNVDPTPSNNLALVELNVVDLNDTAQTAVHQSLISSVRPVRVTIPRGAAAVSLERIVNVRNTDRREASGHSIEVTVIESDCPSGTVGQPDFDRGAAGPQSSAVVRGNAGERARLPLTIQGGSFLTANRRSPVRCTTLVSATGPGGDADPSNDTAEIVLDVLDSDDTR